MGKVIDLAGEGSAGAGTGWTGEVNTFADLPLASASAGLVYLVKNSTGLMITFNLKRSGFYQSDGVSWTKINQVQQMFTDDQLTFQDEADNTKQVGFELSGITTGTRRVVTMPDKNGTMAMLSDIGNNNINSSTGVLTGGELFVGAGGPGVATTYDISDGTGQIVTSEGVVTQVSWTGLTGQTPIFGPSVITFVAINSGGTVTQQSAPFSRVQSRTLIPLGVIVHVNGINVDTINNEQEIAYNPFSSIYDAMESIGFFNVSGNIFTSNGANLNIDKSVGDIFKLGSNYDTAPSDNPHVRNLPSKILSQFQYRFSDGSSGILTETNIDPNNLDNGTGGLTPVGNNQWSIQRIYVFTSNNVKIQRGVADYPSLEAAVAGISTEPYITEPSLVANGLLRGWIIVKKGATALNGADAQFLSAPKFGEGNAGATGAIVDLQTAYDNSVSNPEILTDPTNGALTVRRGSGLDSDNIFEGQNNAGTTNFSITGEGKVTGLDFNGVPLTNGGVITKFLNESGTYTTPAGGQNSWEPPVFSLGDGATSGVSVFGNTGAGAYWEFDGGSDDQWVGNISLENNGVAYDGSNLAIVLHWKISTAPGASDDVEWVVDYAFLLDGDNGQTKATTNTDNVVVDGETADLMFSSQLSDMTGAANAKTLALTITRNSTGAGADTYAGSAELMGIKIIKV